MRRMSTGGGPWRKESTKVDNRGVADANRCPPNRASGVWSNAANRMRDDAATIEIGRAADDSTAESDL